MVANVAIAFYQGRRRSAFDLMPQGLDLCLMHVLILDDFAMLDGLHTLYLRRKLQKMQSIWMRYFSQIEKVCTLLVGCETTKTVQLKKHERELQRDTPFSLCGFVMHFISLVHQLQNLNKVDCSFALPEFFVVS